MNITLSVSDDVVEKAREVARRQGTSLNELVREFLRNVAGERDGAHTAAALRAHWASAAGNSGTGTMCREDAYEGRL